MSNILADAHDLKLRLEWGQPAFTIIDVRDRPTYNHGHITGAISIPLDDLVSRAKSALHKEREIYIYGEHDAHTAHAAEVLKTAGFPHVSEIQGGVTAWKKVGGAIEGVDA